MEFNRIELGYTDELISQFALGTMLMGSIISKDESFSILDEYTSRNGNFIDTANCYAWWVGKGEFCGDESENIIGEWLKSRKNREDLFIATKVGARLKDHWAIRNSDGIPRWNEIPNHYEGASAKVINQRVKDSLKRLGSDYIDLLYIHVDDRNTNLEETLFTLNEMVTKGIVRHIGYSNVHTWRLERIFNLCKQNGWATPVAVQLEYSYLNPAKYGSEPKANHVKEDFFDWMKSQENPPSLVAYSPILKGIYNSPEKADALLQQMDYDSRFTRTRMDRIQKIAAELNISPNVLVLAWMAAKPEKIFPIMGFSSKQQFDQNLEVLNCKLDENTFRALEKI